MYLEQYIKELLTEYTCVVIPGFGGILTHYMPASLQPQRHIIKPPRKRLAFNVNLQTSDGILVQHLVKKLKLQYEEAEKRIQQQVKEWKEKLRQDKELYLADLGTFKLNDEEKVEFSPDKEQPNLLLDAYGLNEVHAVPINRESPQFVEVVTTFPEKNKKRWKLLALISAIIILFVALNVVWLAHSGFNLRENLSGFFEGLITHQTNQQPSIPANQQTKNNQPLSSPVTGDSTSYNGNIQTTADSAAAQQAPTPVKADTSPEIATPSPSIKPKADKNIQYKPVITSESKPGKRHVTLKGYDYWVSNDASFHVITGSFTKLKRAEKYVKKLKKKGYNPEILNTSFGNYRVSIVKTQNPEKAGNLLDSIRNVENSNAWLLIR